MDWKSVELLDIAIKAIEDFRAQYVLDIGEAERRMLGYVPPTVPAWPFPVEDE